MKALTLHQPWASAVSHGVKTIETRTWMTRCPGPLAIHAGRARDVSPQADRVFSALGIYQLGRPFGVVLAVVERVLCVEITDAATAKAILHYRPNQDRYGDLTPGRWAWLLDDVVALTTPVTSTGRQGLWTLRGDVATRVEDQIDRQERTHR